MKLIQFNNSDFDRGGSLVKLALWEFSQFLLFPLPGSMHKRFLLRLFGGKIGARTVIKPYVKIKFPWKLTIGDDSWIGERVWLDNVVDISIGNNCCISQNAYLCCGNHDWSAPAFDLIAQPIVLENEVWVAAGSLVGPGVTIRQGAVVTLGTVVLGNLEGWTIYSGNPASAQKSRHVPASLNE